MCVYTYTNEDTYIYVYVSIGIYENYLTPHLHGDIKEDIPNFFITFLYFFTIYYSQFPPLNQSIV